MTIDHRAEAEKHLATASRYLFKDPADAQTAQVAAAIGQAHAALTQSEDHASDSRDIREALHSLRRRFNDTRSLVSAHIAEGLASREKNRWKAAIDLTKALDEAHCNMDDLVDTRLTDDGWDPRSAYKTPASLVPADDPWAAKPDISGDIPEPVRRVIAERLADMLLSRQDDGWGAEQARRFAYALKNEGADLTGDIEKRITELTLGRDPSDPPF